MGKVTVLPETPKDPISMVGRMAGVCWKSDISDPKKNYERGLECYTSNHGRTLEFPDFYVLIEGYSAKVIREWYTHLGGAPTRLQASTRYIDYSKFEYITPKSIEKNPKALEIYKRLMIQDAAGISELLKLGIPNEDATMALPLSYATTIVDKRNMRNAIDMSRTRMCSRAYWEYRELFDDYRKALSDYSEECATIVDLAFKPKCEYMGFCTEKKSCGRVKRHEANVNIRQIVSDVLYYMDGAEGSISIEDAIEAVIK